MDHGLIGVVEHCLVGPVPLTLAILAAYHLLMKGVGARAIGRDTTSAIFHAVVGILTIPVFVVLLYLWSFAMDLSLPSGVFVWSAILASGHGCAGVATKWQHGRAKLADSQRIAA